MMPCSAIIIFCRARRAKWLVDGRTAQPCAMPCHGGGTRLHAPRCSAARQLPRSARAAAGPPARRRKQAGPGLVGRQRVRLRASGHRLRARGRAARQPPSWRVCANATWCDIVSCCSDRNGIASALRTAAASRTASNAKLPCPRPRPRPRAPGTGTGTGERGADAIVVMIVRQGFRARRRRGRARSGELQLDRGNIYYRYNATLAGGLKHSLRRVHCC